ncbi:MAG TPA: hypothetical protein VF755_25220 [Catenuloplanes sp.]
MIDPVAQPSMVSTPAADRVLCRDSLDRVLLDAAACGACPPGCGHLEHVPVLGRHRGLPHPLRRDALTNTAYAEAVSAEHVSRIDAEAVARWIIGRYPTVTYPAVVLGSAHGGAVHLAAALGAPWLPTGFTVTVRWPGGSVGDWGGARDAGAAVAAGLLARDPALSVRQVHDPVRRGGLCASTLTLHIRWRRLPAAYRSFLRDRLRPTGASLLLRDLRTWPVLDGGPGHTFQLGSPVSGWEPDDYTVDNPGFAEVIRRFGSEGGITPYPTVRPRYAESAGEPELEPDLRRVTAETGRAAHRVLYPNPEALSACVADLYRDWLRGRGGGRRCVVEAERLLAPGHVLAAGLVPYWCEAASRRAVAGAEWWLAGSSRFDSVDVLPAPPGSACDAHAEPRQWRAVAWFGRHRGQVDPEAAGRYPLLPLPTSHATTALDATRAASCALPRVDMAQVLNGLRGTGQPLGIMVP